MNGKFVISLDFEFIWGIRDFPKQNIDRDSVRGVWKVLPDILDIFKIYNVQATFAIVGFLFANRKKDLENFIPSVLPNYQDENLSPYKDLNSISNKEDSKLYFAKELILLIKRYKNIEISTHTFSHLYCLEPHISEEAFEADLKSAIKIAKKYGIHISTIVFPRNQYNENFKKILIDNSIISYRGLEPLSIYNTKSKNFNNPINKILRLLDTYFPLYPHSIYELESLRNSDIINLPSSRFLRPYSKKLWLLENLKITRIKNGMTKAAKENKLYHLWWHPFNFGTNMRKNLTNLKTILDHYQYLNETYHFESETMNSLSKKLMINDN